MAWGRVTRKLCLAAGIAAALALPGLAHGAAAPPQHHHAWQGVVVNRSARSPARARSVSSPWTPDDPGLLTYHGGPVMASNQVHVMYWFPAGYSLDSTWRARIDAWFGNVAADSGSTGNVFGDTAQYGVGYSARFLGSAVDTTPFPASQCSAATVCLTEQQIFGELSSFAHDQGWSGDSGAPTHLVFVYLPPGVTDCFDDPTLGQVCSATAGSNNQYYCAYHTWETSGSQTFVWGNMPYVWSNSGCQSGQFPSGSAVADTAIDVTSHEYIEALTDPLLNAWWDDSSGYEIADKCQSEYGSFLGGPGGAFWNQVINGTDYALQLEYSNATQQCYQSTPAVTSFQSGPAGSTVDIRGANFVQGTTPFVPVTVSFNGIASPAVTIDSSTELHAEVPVGNTAGHITVTALNGTGTSAGVFSPLPAVSSLSASSGYADSTITIHGSGFFNVQHVTFDGLAATFGNVASDGTSLQATVPTAATDGVVAVTTPAGTSGDAVDFGVLPNATGLSRRNAVQGGSVTLTGTGLAGATCVSFSGSSTAATITQDVANTLVVTVPDDAKTGPVTVTTPDGTSTTAAVVKLSYKPTRNVPPGPWPR